MSAVATEPRILDAEALRHLLAGQRFSGVRDDETLTQAVAVALERFHVSYQRDVPLQRLFASDRDLAPLDLCAPFLTSDGIVVVAWHRGPTEERRKVLSAIARHPDVRGVLIVTNLLRTQALPKGIAAKPVRVLDLKFGV